MLATREGNVHVMKACKLSPRSYVKHGGRSGLLMRIASQDQFLYAKVTRVRGGRSARVKVLALSTLSEEHLKSHMFQLSA